MRKQVFTLVSLISVHCRKLDCVKKLTSYFNV